MNNVEVKVYVNGETVAVAEWLPEHKRWKLVENPEGQGFVVCKEQLQEAIEELILFRQIRSFSALSK